jgi:hypothetical protein
MPRTYHPREWPNTARAARDGAAEDIAAALIIAVALAERMTEIDTLKAVTRMIYLHENALRLLEGAGAQTKPAPQ